MKRFLPDTFLTILITAVILASLWPLQGRAAEWFSFATNCAVGLLFFLHGARLSTEAVVAGITHWRLHLTVFASTFILFPILGLAAGQLIPGLHGSTFYLGIIFLCVLPSTIQSSIAFTSIASGNVPAAIVSASASNILGMFITPLLAGLFLTTQGGHGFSFNGLTSIFLQLLLPFIAGQLCRCWIGAFIVRHRILTAVVDRGSIVMVVFLAFSEAMVEGLWRTTSWHDLVLMILFDIGLLAVVLLITWYGAKLLGFDEPDCITIMFCGSKKSLASGAPMANAIFAGTAVNIGAVVLPVMLFHQIQLMACSMITRHLAEKQKKDRDNDR